MSVEFEEAVSAYAASLVAARHTLDTATARLAQAYAADDTLKSLPTPAFRLAEAVFEIPYVVDEVTTEPPAPRPQLPRHTPVTVGEREVASLMRGVDDLVSARLSGVLDQYRQLTDLYRRARESPEVLRSVAVPTLQRPDERDLFALRTGASAMARDRLDRLLRDFEEVRGTLLATAEAMEQGPRTRVLVRLDASALAEADAASVQRARLTFRDVPTTTVDVEGQPLVVPE